MDMRFKKKTHQVQVEEIVNYKRKTDNAFHALCGVLWEQRVAGSHPVIPTISTLFASLLPLNLQRNNETCNEKLEKAGLALLPCLYLWTILVSSY
jgi:hypothetical protein